MCADWLRCLEVLFQSTFNVIDAREVDDPSLRIIMKCDFDLRKMCGPRRVALTGDTPHNAVLSVHSHKHVDSTVMLDDGGFVQHLPP